MSIFYSQSLNAFYNDELHSAMPADCIVITAEKHRELLKGQAEGMAITPDNDGFPVLKVQILPPIQRCQLACQAIDTAAGEARNRIVSDSSLIEVEYQRTYDQATLFINNNYTGAVPQAVKSHAEAYGVSDQVAAETIKQIGDNWYTTLDIIRDLRLKGKQATENAGEEADYMTIAQPFIDQLNSINPEASA